MLADGSHDTGLGTDASVSLGSETNTQSKLHFVSDELKSGLRISYLPSYRDEIAQ